MTLFFQFLGTCHGKYNNSLYQKYLSCLYFISKIAFLTLFIIKTHFLPLFYIKNTFLSFILYKKYLSCLHPGHDIAKQKRWFVLGSPTNSALPTTIIYNQRCVFVSIVMAVSLGLHWVRGSKYVRK